MTQEDQERMKLVSDLRHTVTKEVAGFVATLVLNNDAVTLQRLRQIIKEESYAYWQRRLEETG